MQLDQDCGEWVNLSLNLEVFSAKSYWLDGRMVPILFESSKFLKLK